MTRLSSFISTIISYQLVLDYRNFSILRPFFKPESQLQKWLINKKL